MKIGFIGLGNIVRPIPTNFPSKLGDPVKI